MTKFIPNIIMIWVTPKAAAKHEVLFNKLASGHKQEVIFNFRCDQIHNHHIYEIWSHFVVLLKYDLGCNKPISILCGIPETQRWVC